MWNRRPGVAEEYLKQVAKDFEKYATETYLTALRDPKAPDHLVLAGLRFVQSRKLSGYDDALIELFTTGRYGQNARDVGEACFEALLANSHDQERVAMVFADIGSYPTPHANIRYCADGLRELGTLGIETALTRLANESDGKRRLKRARLLARAAKYRMPESSTFWKTAEPQAIAATIDAWRADLVERGLLDVSLQPLVDSTTSNGFACDDAPGLIDAPE